MIIRHPLNKAITTASLVLIGLTLSSCESLGIRLPAVLAPIETTQPVPTKAVINKMPIPETRTQSVLYPSTSPTISMMPSQNTEYKTTRTGAYTLNFDDADLAEVAKTILSDSLGENYVLSPEVKGRVTLQTTQALTKEELLPTLEMVLRMNNAALIKNDNIYHIEPADSALYSSDLSMGRSVAGYQTRVIPVRNVAAEEIAKLLKPLVHEKTILQVDNTRNILVASGTSEEMQRVLEMTATFDTDVLKGRSFALFSLAHAEPETVIKELEVVFNNKSGDKDPEAKFFRFIPIERLNAILAISHQARYLRDIESWVFRLDKANTAASGGVNVYKVQHVDSVGLADTLNEIFNGTAKKDRSAKVAMGQDAVEISSVDNADTKPKEPKRDRTATGDGVVSNVGKVRIIADEPNNSLVIVATAREYEIIRPIISQLDVMPLQVLIDATIVEVDLKNDLKYGMQWSFDSGNFHNLLSNVAAGDLKGIGPVTGYSLFYSGGTAKAVLNALADKSTINVIASPSLMVLNNQEAFINVGDKVPIATSQSTNNNSVNVTPSLLPTGNSTVSAIVSNNIQMVDTGVTLKITPRVNAGGLVIMKIEQEANQAIKTTTSTLNSPTIQQRKINSSIAVKNGETIVLGGLIREETGKGITGMPFLSDIPIVGTLFGTTSTSNNKTELVILITPRVVENEQNARDVTNEFKRKLTTVYQATP